MQAEQFPWEYQMDARNYGPACIKMIAEYCGKHYSLQYLRDLCGMTREGVSSLDTSYAAGKIGLRTVAVKVTMENLISKIPPPCIVYQNQHRFVVVYKAKKGKICVSDPAKGLLSYPEEGFKDRWYKEGGEFGMLMVLEPMANFKQIETRERIERFRSFKNLLNYFMPYKKALGVLFTIMLVATGLQAVLPPISKSAIDIGIYTQDISFIYMMLIGNIVLLLSITLSNILRDWVLLHVSTRINISLMSDYLIKLMKLPVTFFENKLVGDILQQVGDHERIRSFVMDNSSGMFFSIITFIVFSIILLIYNPMIFFIFITSSGVYVAWTFTFLSIRKRLDWKYFELNARNQSYWVETIGNVQGIKIDNYKGLKRWKWEAIQARIYRLSLKVLKINNAQLLRAQFINSMMNIAVTFYRAIAVINGDITFGVMISAQFIIGVLSGPVAQLVSSIQSAQYAKINFIHINEIHRLKDEDDSSPVVSNSLNLSVNKSSYLKNVSFQYSRSAPLVLKNITLQIPEGKVAAIVGDNRCSKSTLLKLLLRPCMPSYGEICMGGMNVSNINLRDQRAKYECVMQDGKLFNDTIRNNIILDDADIDYEVLQKAVEVTNISHGIEAMPQGYQTMIGEMSRGLSGGQRQQVLITRALYRDSDYLFLDKATNALDTINEQKVVRVLNNVFKNRTVIVVAHRLGTIRRVDQIIVLKAGMIIEIGNHQSLMANKQFYYDLIQSQYEPETNILSTEESTD